MLTLDTQTKLYIAGLQNRIKELEKRLEVAQQPAQEPYGYVTTLRNGTKHFYESMPYLDNAIKCDAVYLAARQPAQEPVMDITFSQFLFDVHTAAGLVSHGKQCKALGERLGKYVMRYREPVKQESEIHVTTQGVSFGKYCWYSHESITGYNVEQLNSGFCSLTAIKYMEWVRASLPPVKEVQS